MKGDNTRSPLLPGGDMVSALFDREVMGFADRGGASNLVGDRWADIAAAVFEARGRPASDVRRVSTAEYTADNPAAPRPSNSVLDLAKIEATGFAPTDGDEALAQYLRAL